MNNKNNRSTTLGDPNNLKKLEENNISTNPGDPNNLLKDLEEYNGSTNAGDFKNLLNELEEYRSTNPGDPNNLLKDFEEENNNQNNNKSFKSNRIKAILSSIEKDKYLDIFYISTDKIEIYDNKVTDEDKNLLLEIVNKKYFRNLYLDKRIDDNEYIYIMEQEIETDIETNKKNKTGIIYNVHNKDNLFKYNITDTKDLSKLIAFINTLNEIYYIDSQPKNH